MYVCYVMSLCICVCYILFSCHFFFSSIVKATACDELLYLLKKKK